MNVVRDYSGLGDAFRDSIGQHSIASFLELFHYKANVFSGTVRKSKEVLIQEIEHHQVPIVGFYAAADNIKVVANMIKWIKERYQVVTVVGGPQAIALDLSFFNDTKNDFVIIGEGEIPVKFLLDCLIDKTISLQQVPSLVYKIGEELHYNSQENSVIQQLDKIPFPKIHNSITGNLRQGSMVGILTGRGCPFSCSFCYEGQSNNLRFRSIDHVMEEIDYIQQNNQNLTYINVYDDTFTINRERVLEFCTKIKKKNIKWFCEGHVSFVLKYPEMLEVMVAYGLVCIQFGLESGSDQVLDAYNKKITSDMIVKAVEICKKAGIITITGNFIIGGALETNETLEATKTLIKRLLDVGRGCMDLHLVYLAPYPNTRIVKNPEQFQLTLWEQLQQWNIYTMNTPVVSTKEFTTHEIYEKMEEMNGFLFSAYKESLNRCTKTDFLQSMYHNNKRICINPIWEVLFFSDTRFLNFSNHLSMEEQEFQPEKYSIRTFDNFSVVEEILHTSYGIFQGLEKEFLLHANGLHTNREVGEILDIDMKEIEKIYKKLNERCLVFVSDF